MRDKPTSEQIETKREKRRKNRSAFWSRMVDEFKKIMVIYATLFVTGFLVWEHIIYANGVTPAFPSAVTVALISGFFTVIVAYCFAAYKEKDSLNKNGLAKTSTGTIAKIAETVSTVAANFTPKTPKENPDDDDVVG